MLTSLEIKNPLLTTTLTSFMIICVLGLAARSPNTVDLRLSVTGEHYCQFTSVTQALTLDAKLTFTNSGANTISIQGVGKIGQVLVARSSADANKRGYELIVHPDYIDSAPEKGIGTIVLKPGESFDKTEKIGLTVLKPGAEAARMQLLSVGRHYLQVESGVAIGSPDPRTWQNISLRSSPILIRVQYAEDTGSCQRSQPE